MYRSDQGRSCFSRWKGRRRARHAISKIWCSQLGFQVSSWFFVNFDLIPRNSSRLDRVHDLNATDRELSSQMPAVLYNQNKGRQVIALYFQQLAPRSSSQRRNNLIFQSLGCKKNCSFFRNLKFQNAQNRQPTEMKENERIEADLRSLLNLPSSVICSAANLNSSCAKNNLRCFLAIWPKFLVWQYHLGHFLDDFFIFFLMAFTPRFWFV